MIFCLGEGKYESKGEGYQKNYRVFNKDVSEKEYEEIKKSLGVIKIKLTEWIKQDDGGELKVYKHEEVWKNWLKESTEEQRQAILDIPQFDEKIFKEITGLTKKDLQGNKESKKKKELIAKAEELKEKADEMLKTANKCNPNQMTDSKMKEKEHIKNLCRAITLCKRQKKESGTIECPQCGKPLNYTCALNYNGHTDGKCTTEKCLNWIE